MTGLDPEKEVILEIATIVTDDRLELVADGWKKDPGVYLQALQEGGIKTKIKKAYCKMQRISRLKKNMLETVFQKGKMAA